MPVPDTNKASALGPYDASIAIALQALAWILSDNARADRLLSLTGLAVDDLRARLDDPSVLSAALSFLETYDQDLIACAHDLGLRPAELVNAHSALNPTRPNQDFYE